MFVKFPKDTASISWTNHIKNKMAFYGLSESKIKSILSYPKRKEEGIAPDTFASMKRNDKKERKEEIWIMYIDKKDKMKVSTLKKRSKILMISAWRYPGVSKVGAQIPIPEDILDEIKGFFKLPEKSLL